MVSETKLEEKWSLKRLSMHSSWGCWLDQYRERLDKEAGWSHYISSFKSTYVLLWKVVEAAVSISILIEAYKSLPLIN